jgi:pilus assembly protein FimV
VAKVNPVKLKQDADKLEKAGRLDQAIAVYKQIVDDNPRDWNTVKKIGDLYARLNKNREAVDEWTKVADFFAKDGFLLKSIAIWKQINKLDPSAVEPAINLADLYAKQGLMMEAKGQYQAVVDEYIKRGKMRDAGDVLKKMADIDPGDLKIRSKLADLYTREGNTGKAVDEHVAIADELNKKGHLAEALQVLEKGLKIDGKSGRLRTEIARIHLLQKNYDRAAHYLEEAVQQSPKDTQILARLGEAYLGAKKIEEAEAIFKRLLELDPEDEESRVQMGRVYLLQGAFDRAHDELLPVVDKLVGRKDGDKAAALLQQIVQKSPQHVKTLVKLVEIYTQFHKEAMANQTHSLLTEAYVNQGNYQEAASVLEILVSREPQNQQHKTKLEFVRSKLGGGAKGKAAPAVPAVPAAPAADDMDEEFDLSAVAEEAPRLVPEPAVPAKAKAAPVSARPPAPPMAPPGRAPIVPTGPLSEEDKEFVEEHLAEGKVFRKYGLVDKAADQFESVVARFPDNIEARQELREVYKEKGVSAKAADQCLALAEIFRLKGDEASAEAQEAEAQRLLPHAAAPVPAPAAPRAKAPAAPPPVEEDIPFGEEEEITVGEAEEAEEISLDEEEAPVVGESVGLEDMATFDLDDQGTEEELTPNFIDEEPAPSPPAEPAFAEPPALEADVPMFGLEDEPAAPTLEEPSLEMALDEPNEPAMAMATPLAARRAPAAPATVARPEVQRALDEVDSFVSLGFVDNAKQILRDVLARFPNDPAVQEKMQSLGLEDLGEPEVPLEEALFEADSVGGPEADAGFPESLGELSFDNGAPAAEPDLSLPGLEVEPPEPEPASAGTLVDVETGGELGAEDLLSQGSMDDLVAEPEPPPPPPPAEAPLFEGGIDLGAELGELFSAQAAVEEAPLETTSTELGDAGLADIFKEFKKGVDKQLGKEDYDTRYNLGIAYKEMGLIDEAIAEFQLAAKDEGRLLECSSMLGICFLEKGMPKLAVKWFEKGLKTPNRSEEEYSALRYDLAVAWEAAGEIDKALSLFTDLYGQDANFRDVAAKVRELRDARG